MNSSKRSFNRTQIEKQFDRAASTYDSVADLQRRMGRLLVERICASDIAKHDPLIDLGCGTGELLSELSKEGFTDLSGLDLSSRMLSEAKKKTPNANMFHADIEDVPFETGSYRTVVSNAAIQWCDTESALQEANRILIPGGNMFLTLFVRGTLAQWELAFESIKVDSRVHRLPDFGSIESAIRALGLKVANIEARLETATFDSVESMLDSIRKLGATNATSSRNEPLTRKAYLALKDYFSERLEQEGELRLDFSWVEVSATK